MRRTRLVIGVTLLVAAALAWIGERSAGSIETQPVAGDTLATAYAEQANDRWIDATLEVVRLLPDDNDGNRHQRFIARTTSGQTLLIAHNIDLAQRVPVAPGDEVRVRGVYEWNERGGVIHWTHHDPGARHAGGHIEHGGNRYR